MPKLHSFNMMFVGANAVRFCKSRSSAWQVRIKAHGRRVRTTTRGVGERDACQAAQNIVLEARDRQRLGLPPESKGFSCVITIDRQQPQSLVGSHLRLPPKPCHQEIGGDDE